MATPRQRGNWPPVAVADRQTDNLTNPHLENLLTPNYFFFSPPLSTNPTPSSQQNGNELKYIQQRWPWANLGNAWILPAMPISWSNATGFISASWPAPVRCLGNGRDYLRYSNPARSDLTSYTFVSLPSLSCFGVPKSYLSIASLSHPNME